MLQRDPGWLRHDQARWLRPDAHRWLRLDAERWRRPVHPDEAKYNPAQPRVPAGNPDGGQWTRTAGPGAGDSPDGGGPPKLPAKRPPDRPTRMAMVKAAAKWLARLPVAGVAAEIYVGTLRHVEWLEGYQSAIATYRDPPRTLDELQNDVANPQPGYHIHHIVEQTPARRFGISRSDIDAAENLVRIPVLRHYEITGWYATRNEEFGGLSPRDYFRNRNCDERRRVGLGALIRFQVLQP